MSVLVMVQLAAPARVRNLMVEDEQPMRLLEFQLKSISKTEEEKRPDIVLYVAMVEAVRIKISPDCIPMPIYVPSLEYLAVVGVLLV